MMPSIPASSLCSYNADAIFYRDRNLVDDLLGKASFLDVFFYQLFGREACATERRIVDAVLICLMEHGLTPSAITTRLVYSSSPENIQSGVAAGLLAVGSRFVGTTEDCARLLQRIIVSDDSAAEAEAIVADYKGRREAVPGFGHHLHKPDDPRAIALLALATKEGAAGKYQAALVQLAAEVDAVAERHITINATGAIAALLGDIGVPIRLMRGFAVLARAAGLIAHIAEEQSDPSLRFVWTAIDEAMSTSVR